MDKNLPALLRDDTYTVRVRFDAAESNRYNPETDTLYKEADRVGTLYTYVTDIPGLQKGDLLVVPVISDGGVYFKAAHVHAVDSDLKIEPNGPKKIKWVVARVDREPYYENEKRNAEIDDLTTKAYRGSLRTGFATQVLASIGDGPEKLELLKLLKKE